MNSAQSVRVYHQSHMNKWVCCMIKTNTPPWFKRSHFGQQASLRMTHVIDSFNTSETHDTANAWKPQDGGSFRSLPLLLREDFPLLCYAEGLITSSCCKCATWNSSKSWFQRHRRSSASATRSRIPLSGAKVSSRWRGAGNSLSNTESHSSSLKGVSTTSICLSAALQTNMASACLRTFRARSLHSTDLTLCAWLSSLYR